MANQDTDPNDGMADKRFTSRLTAEAGNAANIATPANYQSVSAMRTRLAAINAGYYTAARLNQMSRNDMIFAIRQNDDLAGI